MQKFWCNELNRFKYSIKRIFVNLPELRVETAITNNLVRVTHRSNNTSYTRPFAQPSHIFVPP